MRRHVRTCSASLVALVAAALNAAPAHAEIVFFSTGRSLSVKAHRSDGTSLVLLLRAGGEMVCAAAAIVRIEPDEVPYPEESPLVSVWSRPSDPDDEDRLPLRPAALLARFDEGRARLETAIHEMTDEEWLDAEGFSWAYEDLHGHVRSHLAQIAPVAVRSTWPRP